VHLAYRTQSGLICGSPSASRVRWPARRESSSASPLFVAAPRRLGRRQGDRSWPRCSERLPGRWAAASRLARRGGRTPRCRSRRRGTATGRGGLRDRHHLRHRLRQRRGDRPGRITLQCHGDQRMWRAPPWTSGRIRVGRPGRQPAGQHRLRGRHVPGRIRVSPRHWPRRHANW